jgi:hypothetical protein
VSGSYHIRCQARETGICQVAARRPARETGICPIAVRGQGQEDRDLPGRWKAPSQRDRDLPGSGQAPGQEDWDLPGRSHFKASPVDSLSSSYQVGARLRDGDLSGAYQFGANQETVPGSCHCEACQKNRDLPSSYQVPSQADRDMPGNY